jgi:hypothetical protein
VIRITQREAQKDKMVVCHLTEPSNTSDEQCGEYDSGTPKEEGKISKSLFSINLMNQSTIYRRHEARLARSYRLRDDPRPAFLRVMSGLPGFRMIIPPYQPTTNAHKGGKQSLCSGTEVKIGDFSEDTIFSKNGETLDVSKDIPGGIDSKSFGFSVLQTMVATGACAGGAEYVYGLFRGGPSTVSSPFAPKIAASAYPFFRPDGALSVPMSRANLQLISPIANLAATATISSTAIAAALSTSALFGTKVATQWYYPVQSDNGQINDAISTGLLSSILAGGVVGLGQLISSHHSQQRKILISRLPQHPQQVLVEYRSQRRVLGRHVLAACLYFSTYESISASLRQHQEQAGRSMWEETMMDRNIDSHHHNNNNFGILVGGAMAGCAHATVLNYHHGLWRLIPAVARAAPFHAVVFYGFETMRNNSGIQSRTTI